MVYPVVFPDVSVTVSAFLLDILNLSISMGYTTIPLDPLLYFLSRFRHTDIREHKGIRHARVDRWGTLREGGNTND